MNDKMQVYIPTLEREGRQITLESIPDGWKDRVFLACPKEEKHSWPNRIDVPERYIGNIGATRQWILEQSSSPLVAQLDDDIHFIKRSETNLRKRGRIADCGEVLDLMQSWLRRGEVYCGLSHELWCHLRPDEYYYGKPSYSLFVNRDYLREREIRYDTLSYFEDFHVPLSVLESGRKLCYSGKYMARERQPNAKGGCSLRRTAEDNRRAMLQLQELHPKYVKIRESPGAKNQGLEVGLKMTLQFAKAYKDNVVNQSLQEGR
jgi:hypothetical protein